MEISKQHKHGASKKEIIFRNTSYFHANTLAFTQSPTPIQLYGSGTAMTLYAFVVVGAKFYPN
jgi:hypothetical protein